MGSAGRRKVTGSVSRRSSFMAISSISSASISPTQSFNPSAIRQAFSQLGNALQSGDLSAAQSAYTTLSQSPAAQGNGPFAQALQQIGQDLQSGDIAGAQKALAALQQQVKGHHHHHHHGGGQPAQAASNNAAQSSNTTSNDGDANDATTTATVSPTASSSSTNSVNISA
jgi:hypothetical protein